MTSNNLPKGYEFVDKCILCESLDVRVYNSNTLMYKCTKCGLIYDNPRPTQELIWEHYSQKGKYDHWIDSDNAFQKYWNSYLKKLLKYTQSGDLLDIGAGIGMFLSKAKEHFNVTGTEISDEGIAVAKERYGLDFIKGDLESLDFKGKKFDVITMSQILEHVPFPGKTLDHLKSILKPGGILFISVPNESAVSFRMLLAGLFSFLGLKRFRDFTYNGFRKLEIGVLDEIHLSHFTEKNLTKVLKSKNFEILETTIEFHDTFMRNPGPIQIVRHTMLFISILIKTIFRVNTYNSFGVIARLNEKV